MNKDKESDFPIEVFPIEIEYQDTYERIVVDSVNEIECGRNFIVIDIRLDKG